MSEEIVCENCGNITEKNFTGHGGCYIFKENEDWSKGCCYDKIPKRMKEIAEKLIILKSISNGDYTENDC